MTLGVYYWHNNNNIIANNNNSNNNNNNNNNFQAHHVFVSSLETIYCYPETNLAETLE